MQITITIVYDVERDAIGYRCSPSAPAGHQYAALERARDFVHDIHLKRTYGLTPKDEKPKIHLAGPMSETDMRKLKKGRGQ